jgi:hypothetical protein
MEEDVDPWLLGPWLVEQAIVERASSEFRVPSSEFQVKPPAGPVKYRKGGRKK